MNNSEPNKMNRRSLHRNVTPEEYGIVIPVQGVSSDNQKYIPSQPEKKPANDIRQGVAQTAGQHGAGKQAENKGEFLRILLTVLAVFAVFTAVYYTVSGEKPPWEELFSHSSSSSTVSSSVSLSEPEDITEPADTSSSETVADASSVASGVSYTEESAGSYTEESSGSVEAGTAEEAVFNYFTDYGDISAYEGMIADPKTTGSMVFKMPSDFYITNIDSSGGDLLGDRQEILNVPWQQEWNPTNFQLEIGNFRTAYTYPDPAFFFEVSYKEAREIYNEDGTAAAEDADSYIDRYFHDEPVKNLPDKEIGGRSWKAYSTGLDDSFPRLFYINEIEGGAFLVTELSWKAEENTEEEAIARIERYIGLFAFYDTAEEAAGITAVSTDARAFVLTDESIELRDTDHTFTIRRDESYENRMRDEFGIGLRHLNVTSLGFHFYYDNKILPSEDINFAITSGLWSEEKPILQEGNNHLLFDETDETTFISEIFTDDINGRTVYWQYRTDGSFDSYYKEDLYIWFQTGVKEMFWIEDKFGGFDQSMLTDHEQVVRRLMNMLEITG